MSGRREERHETQIAVLLEDGPAVARNVSASGIYIEAELPMTEGKNLSFVLNFDNAPGGPLRMQCEAQVVRVEDKGGGKLGIGARITNLKLERIAELV